MRLDGRKKHTDRLALQIYEKAGASEAQVKNLAQILTTHEKIAVGRRLLIAQAILNGITRRELQNSLGISPNTFTQVNRWPEDEFQEYKASSATNSMSIPSSRSQRSKYVPPFSYEHLKRSYPAHFLLFSIAEAV